LLKAVRLIQASAAAEEASRTVTGFSCVFCDLLGTGEAIAPSASEDHTVLVAAEHGEGDPGDVG
jgi:hypothetical protein